jgi:hypothetical protein
MAQQKAKFPKGRRGYAQATKKGRVRIRFMGLPRQVKAAFYPVYR